MGTNVSSGSTAQSTILALLMPLILVLSILELHLYRLPLAGLGASQGSLQVLMRMAHPWGTLTHAMAASLAATAMVLVIMRSSSGPSPPERTEHLPMALALTLMAASILQLAVGGASSTVALQVASILLVGSMALRFLHHRHSRAEKIVVVLFAAYQLIPRSVLAATVPLRHTGGAFTATSLNLLTAAELIMAAAFIALFLAYLAHFSRLSRGRKIRPLMAASAIVAMLVKFYLDDPQAMALSISHTSGLQLLLPFPLYLFIIWTVIFMAITLRAVQGPSRHTGYAIVFVFLSGFLLVNPYQHLLSGLGFTLLGMKNHPQARQTAAWY